MPWPRPALPLPPEMAELYSIPPFEEIELGPPRRVDHVFIREGKLRVDGDELSIKLYLPVYGDAPKPFLLTLPVMAGGRILLDMIAMQLATHGIASGHIERRGGILKPQPVVLNGEVVRRNGRQIRQYESIEKLDHDLRRGTRRQRAFVAWVAERPEIDATRMGCVGISMGGIAASLLIAVEPRIKVATICLAGGALPDLFMHTLLGRARRWSQARMQRLGLSVRAFERRMVQKLRADPARLAPYVDTSRVLLVQARFDTVIPVRNAQVLWESLGRPRRILVSLEHYSSALVFHWIVRRAIDHSLRCFDRVSAGVAGTP